MKKRIFALLAILTLLLVGCGNDDTTVFDKVNTIDGVTLTLKEDTLNNSKSRANSYSKTNPPDFRPF